MIHNGEKPKGGGRGAGYGQGRHRQKPYRLRRPPGAGEPLPAGLQCCRRHGGGPLRRGRGIGRRGHGGPGDEPAHIGRDGPLYRRGGAHEQFLRRGGLCPAQKGAGRHAGPGDGPGRAHIGTGPHPLPAHISAHAGAGGGHAGGAFIHARHLSRHALHLPLQHLRRGPAEHRGRQDAHGVSRRLLRDERAFGRALRGRVPLGRGGGRHCHGPGRSGLRAGLRGLYI